jgi:SET domain/SAD/SRA domain
VRDQELTKGNAALKMNMDVGCPVRLVRKLEGGGNTYMYEGLYQVADMKFEPSSDGPKVYRFLLVRIDTHSKAPEKAIEFKWAGMALWQGAAKQPGQRHRTQLFRNNVGPDIKGKRVTRKAVQVVAARQAAEANRTLVTSARAGLICADISGGCENVAIPVFNETGDGFGVESFVMNGSFTYVKDMSRMTAAAASIVAAAPPVQLGGPDSPVSTTKAYAVDSDGIVVLLSTEPEGILERSADDLVSAGVHYPLEVFRTADGKGWGVRCTTTINSGAFIAMYAGECMTEAEHARVRYETCASEDEQVLRNNYVFALDHFVRPYESGEDQMRSCDGADPSSEAGPSAAPAVDGAPGTSSPTTKWAGDGDNLVVDAYAFGNVARFINHAKEGQGANCLLQAVLTCDKGADRRCFYRHALFASEEIQPFEELLYNYGPGYWEEGPDECRRQQALALTQQAASIFEQAEAVVKKQGTQSALGQPATRRGDGDVVPPEDPAATPEPSQ